MDEWSDPDSVVNPASYKKNIQYLYVYVYVCVYVYVYMYMCV